MSKRQLAGKDARVPDSSWNLSVGKSASMGHKVYCPELFSSNNSKSHIQRFYIAKKNGFIQ